MPRGQYKDIAYTDFSGGLNTRIDTNLLKDSESPDLQNVVFDGKGSLMPRMGNIIFGATTSATGSIKRTWTTINQNNIEVPIRQVDTGATCWLEYYNIQTAAWENLDAGYTISNPMANALYDYYTYYCNQTDSQRRWNGSSWITSTYCDSAYAKVYINTSAASALGFLSAGSVVIDGEEVYYSSLSGNALSGITFTTAHNGSVGIAQLPTSALYGWVSATSTLPRGSIMYEMDSQMFVTGASGVSGNIVYYSAVDEPWNYTVSAKPGNGGMARYPETSGSITAVSDFDHILTVLKENTIRRLKFDNYADGTAGELEVVSREALITGTKVGAKNHRGMARVENDNVYVSPSGWIKSLSKSIIGTIQTNELSINIRPTVETLKFTNATSIYYDGKLYVACMTSDGTYNNRVLVWDYAFQSWTKFVGWNVGDWFIYNNILYFGASNEIATYQALVNYDDNSYSFNSYWNSKWFDFGIPNEQKRLGLIYVEGYCTSNTDVGVSAYYDGNTASPDSKTIDGADTDYVVTTDTISLLGMNTWGQSQYGGGSSGSTFTLRKFRWWGRFNGKPFHNLQIKVGTATAGYVYKITHIIPYLAKIPGKRIPLASIN